MSVYTKGFVLHIQSTAAGGKQVQVLSPVDAFCLHMHIGLYVDRTSEGTYW